MIVIKDIRFKWILQLIKMLLYKIKVYEHCFTRQNACEICFSNEKQTNQKLKIPEFFSAYIILWWGFNKDKIG